MRGEGGGCLGGAPRFSCIVSMPAPGASSLESRDCILPVLHCECGQCCGCVRPAGTRQRPAGCGLSWTQHTTRQQQTWQQSGGRQHSKWRRQRHGPTSEHTCRVAGL
jgi:hypothetical protein